MKQIERPTKWLSEAIRRTWDVLVAAALIAVTAPLALGMLAARAVSGRPLVSTCRLGRNRLAFREWRFTVGNGRVGVLARAWHLDRLPTLWNLLLGQITLVGPRATTPDEPISPTHARFTVKPGLICLWWIRQRANIAFGTELEADAEYVATRSFRGDLGILARALVALIYGTSQRAPAGRIALFDIPIDNLTLADAVSDVFANLDGPPRQVCFVNADCVNIAYRDAAYRDVLRSADLVLADGIGMKLAGRLFRRDIRENVCGTDLCPRLWEALQGTGKSIYLLGGRRGVARRVRKWIECNCPGTIVAGHHHGYFTPDEEPAVIRQIAQSKADVLLVAFGAPKQDLWIRQHLAATGVKAALGVGGLFDYYCGRIPRAPQWVREIGMEWLFRMTQEPGRLWKRYVVGNTLFLARAFWLRGFGGIQ